MKLTELSGSFRRFLWRRWYEYIAAYRVNDWQFMNYGYAPSDGAPRLTLQPADEPDRFSVQLYHHVASAIDLRGREVLEVGCGRGGGSSFVTRYHEPKRMVGLDYSQRAIKVCQHQHQIKNLEFVHGDAEALPFADDSFDAVINVESSHCYRSMPKFLSEVQRVLRPAGHLLWADLRTGTDADLLDKQMTQCGLKVLEREDITAQVVQALTQDSQRRIDLIARSVAKPLRHTFQEFAGVEGSRIYDAFRTRAAVYLRYALQKPGK